MDDAVRGADIGHHDVGAVDRDAAIGDSDLDLATLQGFCTDIGEDVFEVLTLEGSVAARNHVGGTAPDQVRAASVRALARLESR